MPRDNNGIYTLPSSVNPVVADTEIAIAWANPTMNDLASAMTGSLARDGSSAMTGPLELTDGTVGVPALSFTANPSTGLFRNSTGPAVETSISGTSKLSVGATKIAATVPISIIGVITGAATIYVDPDTGTAAPASPLSVSNAFDTLANANAYANTLVGLLPNGLNIILSSGKTYPVTASLTWRTRVNFTSSTPGTRYTISAASYFTFTILETSVLTDIAFTNIGLLIYSKCTLSNHTTTQPLRTDLALSILAGGNVDTITSTSYTVTRGAVELNYGGLLSVDNNLVLTNGPLTLNNVSQLKIGGTLTLSDGTAYAYTNSIVTIAGAISITLSSSGDRGQLLNVESGSQWSCDTATLSTAVAAKIGIRAGGGAINLGSGNISITCTSTGIYASNGSFYVAGTGSVTINTTGSAMIALSAGGSISITAGRTVVLSGTGKNITATRRAYIEVDGMTITGAVYSPAVNTVGSQNSYILN